MLNLILLLALVLAVVIWFWVKWYKVRNVGKRGGYLLIPCKKNTHELEHMVKSCYWEEFFQPEYYGDGSQDAFPASHHLPGDLFQYCAGNQCDGKYADGYSLSGWNVLVWYCVESDSCSLWTVILADLLLGGIPVWSL